jgi:hypothetical protein
MRKELFLASFLLYPSISSGEETCAAIRAPDAAIAESIGLLFESRAAQEGDAALIDEAIAHWQRCPAYATGFPRLLNGEVGTRTVRVVLARSSSGTPRCASFQGSQITLYPHAMGRSGEILPCGDKSRSLAHELGHVLGLRDVEPRGKCRNSIMAQITPHNRRRRAVTDDECRLVDAKWRTFLESEPEQLTGGGNQTAADRTSGPLSSTAR